MGPKEPLHPALRPGTDEREEWCQEIDKSIREAVGVRLSCVPGHSPDLLDALERLTKQLADDLMYLARAADRFGSRLQVADFQAPEKIIYYGFPLRKEKIEKPAEQARFHLAHVHMGKQVLEGHLADVVRSRITTTVSDVDGKEPPATWKDTDRLHTTFRALDELWSSCANVLDVWQQYEVHLGLLSKILDSSISYEPPHRTTAHLYEHEFSSAARTLLLSNQMGRHAPAPLIRTHVEVLATRLLREPMVKSKYAGHRIEPTGLSAGAIADACITQGIPVRHSAEALKRIYDWGSVVAHLGYRHPHDELWFAWHYARSLQAGFVGAASDQEAARHYDRMIETLHQKGKIRVYKPDGIELPRPSVP